MKQSTSSMLDRAAMPDSSGGSGIGRRSVSRRGVLSAAVPATLLAGVLGSSHAAGAVDVDPDQLVVTTIAEIRALTTADATVAYLVTDPGAEGLFSVDASDTTSADNTGTVLVSASGARFARQFSGPLSAKWFGAKGDKTSDDTVALQTAISATKTIGGTLHIPAGTYSVARPLRLDQPAHSRPIRIVGDGSQSGGTLLTVTSAATAASPMEAMFSAPPSDPDVIDAASYARYEFSEFAIDGLKALNYGIYSQNFVYDRFHRVMIRDTLKAALAVGYGWCNDIDECEFSYNQGDGFYVTFGEINMLNITNTKIFYNKGIGINLTATCRGARIEGCTLQGNDVCDIYARVRVESLSVVRNYFENSAATGIALTNPAETLHTNILINGSNDETVLQAPYPCAGTQISNNYVSINKADSFVAAYAVAGGLDVTGNTLSFIHNAPAPATFSIVRTGTSAVGGGTKLAGLTMGRNQDMYNPYDHTTADLAVDGLAGAATLLHQAVIDNALVYNYAPSIGEFTQFSVTAARRAPIPGQLTDTGQTHNRQEVYEIVGSADGAFWGFDIDLDESPHLAGRYVYVAFWVKTSAAAVKSVLYTSQLGSSDTSSSSGAWRLVSYVDRMPASGTVRFGVGRTGGVSTDTMQLSAPVLSQVGAPLTAYGVAMW